MTGRSSAFRGPAPARLGPWAGLHAIATLLIGSACGVDKPSPECSNGGRSYPASQLLPSIDGVVHESPTGILRDVNGDGYDDVLSGSLDQRTLQVNSQVYFGSSSGVQPESAWTRRVIALGGGSAGDVNGDGFGDVILSRDYDGHASVYVGSPSGPSETAVAVFGDSGIPGGTHLFGVEDVDADGFDDAVLSDDAGTTVVHGLAAGLETLGREVLFDPEASGSFGLVGTGAGDVDGDGAADVVLGNDAVTAAYVYTEVAIGGAADPAALVVSERGFGTSVGGGGDVNGDGFDDVFVGSPLTEIGTARVFLGSAEGVGTEAAPKLYGFLPDDGFGSEVASARDFDGDGYSDLLVGTYHAAASYVFYGAPEGVRVEVEDILDLGTATVHETYGGGDVNGDQIGDVVILTRSEANLGDSLLVYFGMPCSEDR